MNTTRKLAKWVFTWTLLYFVFSSEIHMVYAAPAATAEKMVVLLDASGSMQSNDTSRDAVNWMKKVAALCVGKEIDLSLVTFQGPPDGREKITVYSDNEQIDSVEFNILETKINQIEYDGNKTDHLSAVLKAEELLNAEREDLSDSFLVILSDGNLDYVGRAIGSQAPMTAEETEAANEFLERCCMLAEKGCRIYLIEFGTNVGIFQSLEGIPGIFYLKSGQEKTEGLENSLEDIFSQTQYPVENIATGNLPGESGPNSIGFSLLKDYDLCTVFLRKSQKRQVSPSDITVVSDGNAAVDFEASDGTGVTILSMRNPKEDSYLINLPENVYGFYSIHMQNFEQDFAAGLSLFDRENHMVQRNGDTCIVNAELLPLTLQVTGIEENLQSYSIKYISGSSGKSEILSVDSGNIQLDNSIFQDQKGQWRFELVNDSGKREDALIISFQNQEISENEIEMEYDEAYTGEYKTLINDAIREDGFDAGDLNIVVSPEGSACEINDDEVAVMFHQTGNFDVKVYDKAENRLRRHIDYTVSDKGLLSSVAPYQWAVGAVIILIVIVWTGRRRRLREE